MKTYSSTLKEKAHEAFPLIPETMLNEPPYPTKPFFPREKEFWLYNAFGWGMLIVILLGSVFLVNGSFSWNLIISFDFLAMIVASIEVTVAGLVFRRWYHRKGWHRHGFLKLIPVVLLLGILSGLLFTITVVTGIYFFHVPTPYLMADGEVDVMKLLLVNIQGNGIMMLILVIIWCVMYSSIKRTRITQELTFKALELENSLKEARLNVLSGQINPHFLFNALNNIRFMIHEDARRADESLISLSEILRHSLESSKKEKIELAREFVIVKQYLELMKNQMENRLSFYIAQDPSTDNLLIPPMIVQMLVENAIKHGIDQQKQGGSVTVDCSETADVLTIKVSNTIASNDAVPDCAESKSGLGLDNINKRLSLLYGSSAVLSISQQSGVMVARLNLPKEPVA